MSHLWAKSEPGPSRELLLHLLDVCRQSAEYFRVYQPAWPIHDSVCLPRVLAYSSLLHDFGKVHRDFQSMVHGKSEPFRNRHEILSLAFLDWLRVPESELEWIAASVATHHRDWSFLKGLYNLSESFGSAGTYADKLANGVLEEDSKLLYHLLSCAAGIFRASGWANFAPYDIGNRSSSYIANIRSAIERVEHLTERFAPTPRFRPGPNPGLQWPGIQAAIHTRGWLINADHLASFGARPIERAVISVSDIADSFLASIEKRGLKVPEQWASHQQASCATAGSAVLQAPTGSGKTEAGLLWAARQAEDGVRGRAYLVLPYQASMNAMQDRLVRDLFPSSYPDPMQWTQHIALIHGRSVRKLYELLAASGIEEQTAAELARLQEELARLNAAPLVVCSAFALIRLLFATKRAEERLAPFFQARIVVDEIHAYDTDVTAMTLAALRLLEARLEARYLIMSATIPSHLKNAIQESIGSRAEIPCGEDVLGRTPRHRLQLLEHELSSPDALDRIRRKARSGSVLVIANQIGRAIDIYKKLKDEKVDARLLHGRFNYADRMRIERDLNPCIGRVLVGTQAVEVSLDVDFDCCFSELAPLESLLQRFGRVNRYGIRGPAETYVFTGFGESTHWWRPYRKDHLEQVLAVLQLYTATEGSRLIYEKDIQELIDKSYPLTLAMELRQAVPQKANELSRNFGNRFLPFGMNEMDNIAELERAWEELFDGGEVLPISLSHLASRASTWIERSRYLVPFSTQARWWVRPQWNDELKCFVTDASYSSECGMSPK